MIAKEMLMLFKNKLGFTNGIDRQYSSEFAKSGAKIGNAITIRKPWRPTVRSGSGISIQDVTEESATLTLSSQKGVDFQFTSADLTLSIDRFSERYLKPAVVAVANQVDVDGLQLAAQSTYNHVGTPGTGMTTIDIPLAAQQKLNELACPQDDNRSFFINPAAQAVAVKAFSGLYQSAEKIAEQYERGAMGMALGGTWYMAQNVYAQTVGPLGGTPLVNGNASTGATLSTKGWTASAASRLKKGDVFTIANVYKVNPITKQNTGVLQQFVVTADFSSDGSGNGSVSVSPSITTSGPTQSVVCLLSGTTYANPQDGWALTIANGSANTAYAQNILCHKNAFTLGTADMELPEGVHFAARATDEESGLSIRVVRAYDINNDQFPCRLDILYGLAALRPEWACRITG